MAVFFNQATLTYNGGTANSNIVSGEIVEVITAAKTATPSTYRAGDVITYIVTLANSGAVAVNGLSVSDSLGAYTSGGQTLVPLDYIDGTARYFAGGILQADPTVTDGPPLVISGISVPAGDDAVIVYQARVNAFAPLENESSITNAVSVTGAGIVNPITASATINSTDGAELSITKSVSPSTVTENGQPTYTFVIENRGNTDAVATDDLAVTDTFNPILQNLSVSLDGTALVPGTDYTYDETTGEFATTAGRITVPAATYTQDPATGAITVTPGSTTLTVSGTI